jgi:hypothetical protein
MDKNPQIYPRSSAENHGISFFDQLIIVLARKNCSINSGNTYSEMAEAVVKQAGEILIARQKYLKNNNVST